MDRLVIRPVGWELPYLAQYEAVKSELEGRGIDAHLVEPEPFEEPGPDVVYNIAQLLATPEVVVYLAEQLADHALDVIEGVLIGYLIGKVRSGPKQGMRRRAQILGPDGRVLREVQLPAGEDTADE
jgi:hypothetical protein